MIPSLLAALLGLWLVWAGVLEPELVQSQPWIIALSAALLIILGFVAFRFDYLKWPAITDIAVGAILFALFLAANVVNSVLIAFWMLFWSGCAVGIVSLWSAFYRRSPEHSPAEERATEPL